MMNFSEICVHHHVLLAKHAMCEQQNIPRTPPLSTWFRDSSLYTLSIRRSGAQAVTGGYPLVICYIAMENHHFSWENPLFLWPFSIAMLNYRRELLNHFKVGVMSVPQGRQSHFGTNLASELDPLPGIFGRFPDPLKNPMG